MKRIILILAAVAALTACGTTTSSTTPKATDSAACRALAAWTARPPQQQIADPYITDSKPLVSALQSAPSPLGPDAVTWLARAQNGLPVVSGPEADAVTRDCAEAGIPYVLTGGQP